MTSLIPTALTAYAVVMISRYFHIRSRKKRRLFLIISLCFFVLSSTIYLYLKFPKRNPQWDVNLELSKKESSYNDNKGAKVIIGYYIGGSAKSIMSSEIANMNMYSPVEGQGAGGVGVELPARDVVRARELFPLHGFNILASDRMDINRSLADVRSSSCQKRVYDVDYLQSVSVIIVFHNEAWSTLMRTVVSVISRSPASLLQEIILVDDASDRKYLGAELEKTIGRYSQVRLLRAPRRRGLVAARLQGARNASGEVLLFLDAHCEVTKGWLEPLVQRATDVDAFVCPHIDLISDETMAYVQSTDAHWGAFNRRLQFRWLAPSASVIKERIEHPDKPYPTPAMAGGLFAVRKSLFWNLGGYDEGMKVWGGENLELSWRAWQCGARVEIEPCSRVGHIFRNRSPYTYPGGVASVLYNNLARAALVWMDQWADFFFKFNAEAAEKKSQDVESRMELRQTLNCKSFEWYLNNVWPQHFYPTNDRWFGKISSYLGACLSSVDINGTPGLGGPASGTKCGDKLLLEGLLVFTKVGNIMADDNLCLEAGSDTRVVWRSCSESSEKQMWKQKGAYLKLADGSCLTLNKLNDNEEGIGNPLEMSSCINATNQMWKFERIPWR